MALEKFHFTGADGKDYTLPKQLKAGDLRAIRKLNDADQMFTLFEKFADKKTLLAIDDLSPARITEVYNEWLESLDSGESSGSSS